VTGPGGDGERSLKAEINVTPLVDVVLVLLIIFMVVTPLLARGKEVRLPRAGAAATQSPAAAQAAIVLTVTAERQVWLERRLIRSERLAPEIERAFAAHRQQQVLIKADASLTVRDLRPLLSTLKAAGAQEIAFAVLGRREERP
jgi:biopolymer transport protein ExbD